MERFFTFVFVAGVGCFAIAFVLSMVFPWMSLGSYHGMDYQTLEDLAAQGHFRPLGDPAVVDQILDAVAEISGETSPG